MRLTALNSPLLLASPNPPEVAKADCVQAILFSSVPGAVKDSSRCLESGEWCSGPEMCAVSPEVWNSCFTDKTVSREDHGGCVLAPSSQEEMVPLLLSIHSLCE